MQSLAPDDPVSAPPPAVRKAISFPLGLKIACLVTGLVVLVVGGFGWVSAHRARLLLETEIDARGIQIARILAQGLPRATHSEFGRTWSVVFEDAPVVDATGEWRFRRQEERKSWQTSLQELRRGGEVVNVQVVEGGVPTLAAYAAAEFAFTETGEPGPVTNGACRFPAEVVPARRFREPVHSIDGKKAFGHVEVYLSLLAVDRARQRILTASLIVGAGALVVGVALSFFIGGMLSRPIRRLAHDMAIVRTGNLEHLTNVATHDEVGMLAGAFNAMTVGLRDAEKVRVESERMRNDLRLARDIQAKLLPRQLPGIPRYDIAATYEPALEVSGDYYDIFALPDHRFAITVGDVSGKGTAAGLVMTMTRSLVRMGAETGLAPVPLLSQVNAVLHKDLKRGTFVTLIYVVLDPVAGVIHLASAGHNPPCLWSPQEGKSVEVNASGIALGIVDGQMFQTLVKEEKVALPDGARLVIYTDGVTEAKDPGGEDLGIEPLQALMENHPHVDSQAFLHLLMQRIAAHRRSAPPSDDITVLTFRRLA